MAFSEQASARNLSIKCALVLNMLNDTHLIIFCVQIESGVTSLPPVHSHLNQARRKHLV